MYLVHHIMSIFRMCDTFVEPRSTKATYKTQLLLFNQKIMVD